MSTESSMISMVVREVWRRASSRLDEHEDVDLILVPLGLLVLAGYHSWLLSTIIRHPYRTVIGVNALARKRWVRTMMADPLKNGVLAVQTIRNNIMASTVLATTAITLSSLISVFVGVTTSSTLTATSTPLSSIKFFSISLCFILAFLCNVQSIRYYAHVSFLLTVPASREDTGGISAAYVTRNLNRGSFFWSLGMRAFYVSFTLFLWIFGPWPMLACCLLMCCLLYFLDTAEESARDIHDLFNGE